MAVKAPGDYDPNTGWPPDNSTGVNWQNDVDLPGQFKGGGAGFGPGGFQGSPRLTAPAAGPPPGLSLPTGGGGSPAAGGPTIVPPANSTIPLHKSVGPFTGGTSIENMPGSNWDPRNWFRADPTATFEAGKPMGQIAAGGAVPSILGGGNPYWRGAIAAGGVLTPTPAETGEFNPAMITGRPDAPLPLHMPHRPVTPTPGATPMPARPVTPTPRAMPARPVTPTPSAAGPAAVKQQPNLGYFTTGARPNANPDIGGGMLGGGFAGGRGGPVGNRTMGMLDLSKLFSRQQ